MGKSSKGYSTGGGKKWLIGFGIVALVAIIVVVVLLCIPPNTYNMVQTLNRTTQTSFLVEKEENANYNSLQAKIKSDKSSLKYYSNELSDYQTLAGTITNVLDFYNDNIIFASSNKNLNNNYKPIKNNLNSAKNSQAKMSSQIKEILKLSDESNTTIKNMIVDIRRDYISWLTSYQKAIHALNKAYTGSMGNILENNEASKAILNGVDDYISAIIVEIKKVEAVDKKGYDNENYNYDTTKTRNTIFAFSNFVSSRLVNKNDIINYYFNSSLQTKYTLINKFDQVYSVDSFVPVIETVETVSGSGYYYFTKSFSGVEDSQGVLGYVKNFLGGR